MIGYIYKIESDCKEVLYIGSTIQKLSVRFSDHKKKYQKCKITKYINSFNYKFSNGCELLKEYEIVDRKHLLAYEQLFLNMFKHCINRRDAFGLLKKEKHKENMKEYYKNNKDKINQKHKKYNEANKQKSKDHYERTKIIKGLINDLINSIV